MKIISFYKKHISKIRKNKLLIAVILTSVFSDFILRSLTVGNVYKIRPIIASFGIILIFSIALIFFSSKKYNYLYIFFVIIITVFNISNYTYYRHFTSFLSFSLISQSKNLVDMKLSLTDLFDFKVLLFFIPLIIYLIIYKKFTVNFYIDKKLSSHKKVAKSACILGFSILMLVATTLSPTDISRFIRQWNREYLVENFGIYSFSVADLAKSVTAQTALKTDTEDYSKMIKTLVLDNKNAIENNQYTNILEGKDLFVIHYESAQNFVIDLAFAEGEVTPFLNDLSKNSLYFSNFYPQISVGNSSDSEFTFSTSLYPINNKTVFINHADKNFQSLEKLLKEKEYYTIGIHGNDKDFWNRDKMYANLGYDEFLGKEDLIIDEIIGLGLSDKSFYRQSAEIIKNRKENTNKPIMAKLITLSNHYPFKDIEGYGEFNTGYLSESLLGNYLQSMHYADQALQSWFEEMDEKGLLDNAAVIIYGDHHAKIAKSQLELLYNYDEENDRVKSKLFDEYKYLDDLDLVKLQKTPLLIWTKDQSLNKEVKNLMGMIDLMPTLSNMLNINNQFRFGQDIFSKNDNTVVFPDGSFLTRDYYYSSKDVIVYDVSSNQVTTEDKFSDDFLEKILSVEKELEFSEKIIENNLINYYQDQFD